MTAHQCPQLKVSEKIQDLNSDKGGKYKARDGSDLFSAHELSLTEQHGVWVLAVNNEYGIIISHCPCCGERLPTNQQH
jgi:exosome complex RNA-binding protein Csl4